MKVYGTVADGGEEEEKERESSFFYSIWKIMEHVNSDGMNPFIKKDLLIEETQKMREELVFDKATRDGISRRRDTSTIATGEKKRENGWRSRKVYGFGGEKRTELLTDQEFLYFKWSVSQGDQLRTRGKREDVAFWKESIDMKYVNLG